MLLGAAVQFLAYSFVHGVIDLIFSTPATPPSIPPAIVAPAPPMGQEMEALARQINGEEILAKYGP